MAMFLFQGAINRYYARKKCANGQVDEGSTIKTIRTGCGGGCSMYKNGFY